MKKIEPFRVVISHSLKKILLIMRIAFVLILLGLLQTQAKNAYSQKTTLSVNFSNTELVKVLDQIENKSDFLFLYNEKLINPNQKVSINVQDRNIEDLLDALLDGTDIEYSILDRKIILTPKAESIVVQQVLVKGRVTDSSNSPLPGVTVIVKGTTNGTITNFEGVYILPDVSSDAIIQFSFVGMKTIEVAVDEKKVIDVVMEEDAIGIEEVVAVGYGTQKKVNLTGSVGKISAKGLKDRPVQNATQMLQGLTPGLNITQSNGGGLADTPNVNIRGVATIGEGSTGGPLILIDGMEGNINAINPQDIDNVTVLKDAAASSIYGSRAPFGVILITTKKGEKGRPVINYNNSFRMNSPVNIPKMVDSYVFAVYFNDANMNGGSSPFFSDERMQRIKDYQDGVITTSTLAKPSNPNYWNGYTMGNANNDWYDIIFRNQVFSQEHNVSFSGGNDKIKYYLSSNYLDQNGLMHYNQDTFDRYATTFKIDAELTNWASISIKNRFIREDYGRPSKLTNDLFSSLARQGWPVLPLYDPNGYMFDSPSPALGLRDGGRDKSQKDWLYQQAQLMLEPIKGWKTFAEFNYRTKDEFRHWDIQKTYNHDVSGNPYVKSNYSNVYESANRTNYLNTNVYSEYSNSLNDYHNFKVMVGFQSEENKYRNLSAKRDGIIVPSLSVLNLTSGTDASGEVVSPSVSGLYTEWATCGFFGRLNYNYNEKYLLEVNLRYDGTSRFRDDKRWNWFPSVSGGWNIAREDFLKPMQDIVSTLKLRASYGKLGNQNTSSLYPTYVTMPVAAASGSWLIDNSKPNTSDAPGLISQLLTWERVKTWNIGLDISMFNNRFSTTFDVYRRITSDMVGPAPELPVILGTAVPKMNNTDLKTSGFELMFNWKDHLNNGLTYSASFQLSDSQTEITKYPNPTGSLNTYREGQKMGEIWGYETIGIAKSQEEMDNHLASLENGAQNALGSKWEAGDIMYKDLNGDGKISGGANTINDHGDLKIIGNNSARYHFSLDLNAAYKGFDIRAFFQGIMKRDYWRDNYYMWGASSWGIWWSTALEEHMDYFRDDPNHYLGLNMDSYYPRPLFSGKNQQVQSRYLQDASYIRLKNLQIGYTLPHKLTKKAYIERLRIYLSGENIWTGTKMMTMFDPETVSGGWGGNVYPLSKTYSIGISINF